MKKLYLKYEGAILLTATILAGASLLILMDMVFNFIH